MAGRCWFLKDQQHREPLRDGDGGLGGPGPSQEAGEEETEGEATETMGSLACGTCE